MSTCCLGPHQQLCGFCCELNFGFVVGCSGCRLIRCELKAALCSLVHSLLPAGCEARVPGEFHQAIAKSVCQQLSGCRFRQTVGELPLR